MSERTSGNGYSQPATHIHYSTKQNIFPPNSFTASFVLCSWKLASICSEILHLKATSAAAANGLQILNSMVTAISGGEEPTPGDVDHQSETAPPSQLTSPIFLEHNHIVSDEPNKYNLGASQNDDSNFDTNNVHDNSGALCWDISGKTQRDFRYFSVAMSSFATAANLSQVYGGGEALATSSLHFDEAAVFYNR